jgi:hypothetical protein
MTKDSAESYLNRREIQYDYDNQAWIINGVYQDCNHPESMDCQCFGRLNAGKRAPSIH